MLHEQGTALHLRITPFTSGVQSSHSSVQPPQQAQNIAHLLLRHFTSCRPPSECKRSSARGEIEDFLDRGVCQMPSALPHSTFESPRPVQHFPLLSDLTYHQVVIR